MGAYPPPPPPPPGSGGPYDPQNPYGPRGAYTTAQWKAQSRVYRAQTQAQSRAIRAQAKLQRAQWRAQRRSLRRGSLVGPLVLLALGFILLMEQLGRLSWTASLEWYARWWPVVLIVAGIILMAEWALDQQRQESTGVRGTRVLGAGVVFLLILLAAVGWSARWTESGAHWKERYLGHDLGGLDRVFGEARESDDSVSSALPNGAPLTIHDPWGSVSVTGSSDDGQVHVSVHKQVYALRDSVVDQKQEQLQPVFSQQNGALVLSVGNVEQGQADLSIEVPHDTVLSIDAGHGDVTVSQIHAPVTVSSRGGDLDLSGIDGTIDAHVNDDDASVTAHSLTGSFTLEGRAGDITLSDINGSVALQGDFFGTTHAERIAGPLRFQTSRTQFQAARIDGEADIESGDLQVDRAAGPLVISSRDRTIEADDVSGSVQIGNRNGAVSVTAAQPLGPVDITNQHGSVDLGLPGDAGFVLNAEARNGDMENDFGLVTQGPDEARQLSGTVSKGGPQVRIVTSDGDITVQKSAAPPLPPAPPASPKITMKPPRVPASPRVPAVAVPATPKAPAVPQAPSAPRIAFSTAAIRSGLFSRIWAPFGGSRSPRRTTI